MTESQKRLGSLSGSARESQAYAGSPLPRLARCFVPTSACTCFDAPTHAESKVLLQDDVVDEIKKLKAQDGSDLQVHGSANLIQTLLKHDLVDELWLKIFPITLGKGKRLFGEGTIPAAFTLREAKISPRGVIIASYERAGDVQTGSVV